jgi:hypothetical protein
MVDSIAYGLVNTKFLFIFYFSPTDEVEAPDGEGEEEEEPRSARKRRKSRGAARSGGRPGPAVGRAGPAATGRAGGMSEDGGRRPAVEKVNTQVLDYDICKNSKCALGY